MNTNHTIIGIDPGTNNMGYAVLSFNKPKLQVLSLGTLRMDHLSDHPEKLKAIFEKVCSLIVQYQPTEMAIEAPFFGKNVQSMLKLGRAQGVCIAAGMTKGLPVTEYLPKRVKQAVTGSGNASKEQVAGLLQSILKISLDAYNLDATDALSVALAHHYSLTNPLQNMGKKGGWEAFLTKNADRVSGMEPAKPKKIITRKKSE